jgi:hypothetical protein
MVAADVAPAPAISTTLGTAPAASPAIVPTAAGPAAALSAPNTSETNTLVKPPLIRMVAPILTHSRV